jgi:hypothetical protein
MSCDKGNPEFDGMEAKIGKVGLHFGGRLPQANYQCHGSKVRKETTNKLKGAEYEKTDVH